MNRWQIYWLNQIKSRNQTDPRQPTDKTKPRRMFLILGKAIFHNKITCAEIITLKHGRTALMTEVEVLANDCNALSNDSLILCHELVTVPVSCFDRQMAGVLPEKYRAKVGIALRNHLPY